jgi:hypothetical protein
LEQTEKSPKITKRKASNIRLPPHNKCLKKAYTFRDTNEKESRRSKKGSKEEGE